MRLYIKSKVHDVTILDNIVLAFNTKFSSFTDSCFRTIFNVIVVLNNLCTDESFLKVSVDNTGTLWGFPSLMEGPSLYFHFTGSDESLEIQ